MSMVILSLILGIISGILGHTESCVLIMSLTAISLIISRIFKEGK